MGLAFFEHSDKTHEVVCCEIVETHSKSSKAASRRRQDEKELWDFPDWREKKAFVWNSRSRRAALCFPDCSLKKKKKRKEKDFEEFFALDGLWVQQVSEIVALQVNSRWEKWLPGAGSPEAERLASRVERKSGRGGGGGEEISGRTLKPTDLRLHFQRKTTLSYRCEAQQSNIIGILKIAEMRRRKRSWEESDRACGEEKTTKEWRKKRIVRTNKPLRIVS